MINKSKIGALILAFAMVIGGIGLSYADEQSTIDTPTTTIEITTNENIESQKFAVYRLLNVTMQDNGGEAVYTYFVNPRYKKALQSLTGAKTDNDIITAISKLNNDDMNKFAKNFYSKKIDPEYTTLEPKLSDIPQGYYLLVQTINNSSASMVMFDTCAKDNINIKAKDDIPTAQNKTRDINDSTNEEYSSWQDSSDYDIGDSVPFKLTAILPSNYKDFNSYKLEFHNVESAGFTFEPESLIVKVNDVAVTSDMYTLNTNTSDGCSFEVILNDIKPVASSSADLITVEYTSKLNENAIVGAEGNESKMYIVYPEDVKNSTFGKSSAGSVKVFTYKLTVMGENESEQSLKGAKFSLYKYDTVKQEYFEINNGIESGKDITTFDFSGIDDGKYKLTEKKVPNGSKKINDIEFEIISEHDEASMSPQLISLTTDKSKLFKIDLTNGTFTTSLKNIPEEKTEEKTTSNSTVVLAISTFVIVALSLILFAKAMQPAKHKDDKK